MLLDVPVSSNIPFTCHNDCNTEVPPGIMGSYYLPELVWWEGPKGFDLEPPVIVTDPYLLKHSPISVCSFFL